jgi:hypothetical protein
MAPKCSTDPPMKAIRYKQRIIPHRKGGCGNYEKWLYDGK